MEVELLSFSVDLWLNIFEGVKDLIWKMLNFDLKKWLKVYEVLKYLWI